MKKFLLAASMLLASTTTSHARVDVDVNLLGQQPAIYYAEPVYVAPRPMVYYERNGYHHSYDHGY